MSDTPTILEVPDPDVVPASEVSYRNGWLTGDAYLAWVQGHEGVLTATCPLMQPPTCSMSGLSNDVIFELDRSRSSYKERGVWAALLEDAA